MKAHWVPYVAGPVMVLGGILVLINLRRIVAHSTDTERFGRAADSILNAGIPKPLRPAYHSSTTTLAAGAFIAMGLMLIYVCYFHG